MIAKIGWALPAQFLHNSVGPFYLTSNIQSVKLIYEQRKVANFNAHPQDPNSSSPKHGWPKLAYKNHTLLNTQKHRLWRLIFQ